MGYCLNYTEIMVIDSRWKGTEDCRSSITSSKQNVQGTTKTFAMVSLFSAPNASLLKQSSGALAVCKYQGGGGLKVIPTSSIMTVVGMVPFPAGEDEQEFFL